ncbi:MAG: GNAT family N-acetyltransferase [Myxococcota bacterium]
MFIGEELDAFLAMMEQHVSAEIPEAATLLVVTDNEMHDAPVVGAAYFAPEVMAQGVMNLLFIGVLGTARRRGFGAQLLEQFEEAAQGAGSRLAIIETASERQFAPAWALYQRRGYEEEARVRDYYDRGVHKLIFRKALPHTV